MLTVGGRPGDGALQLNACLAMHSELGSVPSAEKSELMVMFVKTKLKQPGNEHGAWRSGERASSGLKLEFESCPCTHWSYINLIDGYDIVDIFLKMVFGEKKDVKGLISFLRHSKEMVSI